MNQCKNIIMLLKIEHAPKTMLRISKEQREKRWRKRCIVLFILNVSICNIGEEMLKLFEHCFIVHFNILISNTFTINTDDIWPSRKLSFECQKIAKNLTFFSKNYQKLSFFFLMTIFGIFFLMSSFWPFFLHSNDNFPEGQAPI